MACGVVHVAARHAVRAVWETWSVMASVETLHRLVDDLPPQRRDVAARVLEGLRDDRIDPLLAALLAAPDDDEPATQEGDEGVREYRSGRARPWEEVRRELGGG